MGVGVWVSVCVCVCVCVEGGGGVQSELRGLSVDLSGFPVPGLRVF